MPHVTSVRWRLKNVPLAPVRTKRARLLPVQCGRFIYAVRSFGPFGRFVWPKAGTSRPSYLS